jgi:2-oxoglutarate/2-oxoacid ferredoxin oxidoreductase subunit alpha
MKTVFMQGNEACAYGALAAGCRFFGGYPITPSTSIAETLARELPRVGGKFIQMEDEIASLAAVLGASVGGAKSMTATSGPGFSLMQEHIGYGVMAEIPCVIVNVQRLGPSTGQPTSPSQGDVMQARWGTHGDHPIIALCPTSVRDCFDLTVKAFNLSEKYRIPVILLMDEVVGHMREKVTLPDADSIEVIHRSQPTVPPEWYVPYDEAADVPAMASFGDGFRYHITGLFHDKAGFPTQRLDEINPWINRIFRKIEGHKGDIIITEGESLEDVRTLVVAYGSVARSARQAVHMCRRHKVGLLVLKTLWPFPRDEVMLAAHDARRVIFPEMNMGQLVLEAERLIGRHKVRRVNRADGEMITPEQIRRAIEYKE